MLPDRDSKDWSEQYHKERGEFFRDLVLLLLKEPDNASFLKSLIEDLKAK